MYDSGSQPAKLLLSGLSTDVQVRKPEIDPELMPKKKPAKKNVGGASQVQWFNVLLQHTQLQSARNNLFSKIANTETLENGCKRVLNTDANTRPVLDSKFQPIYKQLCPDGPARFMQYQIAMLQERRQVPSFAPPAYPASLRKVKQRRFSNAAAGNEKNATWVISHLCHNNCCVNAQHLTWEPSWYNRLRDNCPGGEACVHGRRQESRCLAPHRKADEIIDWEDYLEEDAE